MKPLIRLAIGALALIWGFQAAAQSFDAADEARIKELALQALLEKPEILREAIAILKRRDAEAQTASVSRVLRDRRAELERDPNAPVLGNPEGDVTIVEFFDYNCPYCKRAAKELKPLLAADGGVRLVYREWPILGEGSVFATRAALAARKQGKYEEMHWALMAQTRVNEASTLKAARDIGLDIERMRADMQAPEVAEHIALSMALANDLGITGTPSFVIGDALAPGLIPRARMESLIADVRQSR